MTGQLIGLVLETGSVTIELVKGRCCGHGRRLLGTAEAAQVACAYQRSLPG